MPDHWYRDEKYPDICDKVRDVREVCKRNQVEAFAFNIGIPIGFYGPAN